MSKIIGQALPGIPWEEKPEGYQMPLWRYSKNPIIGRDETGFPTVYLTVQ